MNRLTIPALFASALALPSLHAVDFAHEVMPILEKHCTECHTGSKKKGGLSMNTRAELLAGGENGEVVDPGNPSESLLIALVESTDDIEWMPPKGPRLPREEIEVLSKWIEAGLPWDKGIRLGEPSWEPPLLPRVVTLPPAGNGRNHPIDRILDADLARRRQAPPPRASDAAFLRRATLDTIGLLPTPEEWAAFLADADPDKRTKRIDALLADDIAYADHWLTTWNDLLRNDYTGTGFITKGRTRITTWLYHSLRENKPYDQLVRELIAPPTPASAGFIDGIKWRGDVNASQTREIQFSQNVSQVFLGINMKCASCHDSFIDRWTLAEAYNLAAIYSDMPLELNRCDKPTGKMATPRWIFPEIGDVDPEAPKAERLRQLAGLMTHPDNGRFTRTLVNRIWERLMGRGIAHPVDAMHTRPWNEDLLDYLAARFARDGYDLRKMIRFIMTSHAYQSQCVILEKEPGDDYAYAGPVAKRMTAEQFLDSIWQVTGTHPSAPEAKVDRAANAPEPESPGPAAATLQPVPVKAAWIWHQGPTGEKSQLRKTFALSGDPVAARMMATCDNAFVMKINGTTVTSSREWQKPVRHDITRYLRKGENRIEVDAEMFGGSAGFICQVTFLDGGEQKLLATDGTWEARPPNETWAAAAALKPHGAAPWGAILDFAGKPEPPRGPAPPVRAALVKNNFLMRSLGRPHRDQVVTTRPAELTTLQAIDLANGDILTGYLSRGARHLAARGIPAEELGPWLYRYALSREPAPGELEVLADVTGDGSDPVAVEDLLWLVFMQPEFQIIR